MEVRVMRHSMTAPRPHGWWFWISTVTFVALFAVSNPYVSVANETVNCQTNPRNPYVKVCTINEPNVTSHSLIEYPQVSYHRGDSIAIQASGCVQTGGGGPTWKLYTFPRGRSSDLLYHGLVYLPGVWVWRDGRVTGPNKWTWDGNDVKRVGEATTKGYMAVTNQQSLPVQWLHLWLGYEDTEYRDNGYSRHDNGNEDQCKGVGNAQVVVTILSAAGSSAAGSSSASDSSAAKNPVGGQTTGSASSASETSVASSNQKEAWRSWTFPSPFLPTLPANPYHLILGGTYSNQAPNNTVFYTGVSQIILPNSKKAIISSVKNSSSYLIQLSCKDVFGRPNGGPVGLGPGESTSVFKGDANARWEALAPQSGTTTNTFLLIPIDISWQQQ
jgi:hypothetical protein